MTMMNWAKQAAKWEHHLTNVNKVHGAIRTRDIVNFHPLLVITFITFQFVMPCYESYSSTCFNYRYFCSYVNAGCEVPDDRNMLNEQLWSPDRPKFRGQRFKGICLCVF